MKKLTASIEYKPDRSGAADPVPWRYVVCDAEGITLSNGYASTPEKAEERAREDAAVIREREDGPEPTDYEIEL